MVHRPRLHLIATGGTIAGTAPDPTDTRNYTAGTLTAEELIASVPPLKDLAEISVEQLYNLDSKDMTPDHWLGLARATQAALDRQDVDGVVITHGTDTMEESAWFLHLTVRSEKPVVMTGAMRPANHPQADGPGNLQAAVRLAAEPRRTGVWITMNGATMTARAATKSHTAGLNAFAHHADCQDFTTLRGRFSGVVPNSWPRIDILMAYAGAPTDLIDACVCHGARGLILALAGHGSIPTHWHPSLLRARAAGLTILRGSRCAGPVWRSQNAEPEFLATGDLPPVKARILLMLSVAAGLDATDLASILESVNQEKP